jgi:hypothetical protein
MLNIWLLPEGVAVDLALTQLGAAELAVYLQMSAAHR